MSEEVQEPMDVQQENELLEITRRELLMGAGMTLGGMLLLESFTQPAEAQQIAMLTGRVSTSPTLAMYEKPVFTAPAGSMSVIEHSKADTLFWTDIFAEHSMFFANMLPGPELAAYRQQALEFEDAFRKRFAQTQAVCLDPSTYKAYNCETIDMIKRLLEYKLTMRELQKTGRLHGSLVWPLFWTHTAREADRSTRRLAQLNGGDPDYSTSEVIKFWGIQMEEHADFAAHLLDPKEKALQEIAERTSNAFAIARRNPVPVKAPAMLLAKTIEGYKKHVEKGLVTGQIDSAIDPRLMDHVRREAVRFQDELRRA
jgi:hypothetical protein